MSDTGRQCLTTCPKRHQRNVTAVKVRVIVARKTQGHQAQRVSNFFCNGVLPRRASRMHHSSGATSPTLPQLHLAFGVFPDDCRDRQWFLTVPRLLTAMMSLRNTISSEGPCSVAFGWAPFTVGAQRRHLAQASPQFVAHLSCSAVRWYPSRARSQLELSFLWVPEAAGATDASGISRSGAFGGMLFFSLFPPLQSSSHTP